MLAKGKTKTRKETFPDCNEFRTIIAKNIHLSYFQNYNRADSKLYKDAAKLQRVMKSKLEELEDDVEVVPILEEVSKFYRKKILYVHL